MKSQPTIKLGQLKKDHPLKDKQVYGLRVNIARRVIRGLKKQEFKSYWDEWYNGRESGNIDFELAPSEPLRLAFVTYKKIDWPEYKKRFYIEMENNPKSQNALDYLSNYDGGIVTLLCHCKDENFCHRILVKDTILNRTK
jgi:uncharacterized protein YeaO (DUF488 family)